MSKSTNSINNIGKAIIRYAEGGEIDPPGIRIIRPSIKNKKNKSNFNFLDSLQVKPSYEFDLENKLKTYNRKLEDEIFIPGRIDSENGSEIIKTSSSLQVPKEKDPIVQDAKEEFKNWYTHPETIKRFAKNTGLDPKRLQDFVGKGLNIPVNLAGIETLGTASNGTYKDPTLSNTKYGQIYYSNKDGATGKILVPKQMKTTVQHELTHGSKLDTILGNALINVTGVPSEQKQTKGYAPGRMEYMSNPQESYGNFHGFRLKLGLKPGQQIDKQTLLKLVKEKKAENDNFYQTFDDDNIVKAINTIADNNKDNSITYAAMGGYLKNTKQYALGGELTHFNEGGTHEQNPLGGIPIGENATVEEGETKMKTPDGQFIFSDRIEITPKVAESLNLSKSWIGKTMADYSKKIDNQFKDRNDPISRATKQRMLDKGATVQEEIKAQQQALYEAQNVNALQAPEDMMNGQIPNGTEEYLSDMQMGYGGYRKKMFSGGPTDNVPPTIVTNEGQLEALKSNSTNNSGLMSGLGIASNALGGVGQALFQENSKNLNYTPNELAMQSGWERTKDTVASAIPIAGLFRGAEKLGKGLGQAIGGDAGGDFASGFLDPFANVLSKDTNFGEKALSILDPVVAGFINRKKNDQRRIANANKNAEGYNRQFSENYANGGLITPHLNEYLESMKLRNASQENAEYAKGGKIKKRDPLTSVNQITPINNTPFENSEITANFNRPSYTKVNPTFMQKLGLFTDNVIDKAPEYLNEAGDRLGNALRYAPLAMDAYQLSQLKKPQAERLDRLSNRYVPNYIDLAAQQNLANQELNNVSNAIQASGASQGAIRSNLLGAQLNRNRALSEAYMNAQTQNAQQNTLAQQFNLGVDSTNLNQSNTEKDINARNLGNYETQKSRLLSNIGTTAGEIGREEKYKDITKTLFGYDTNGRYVLTPDGTKQYVNSLQAKKLGGLLINKRK